MIKKDILMTNEEFEALLDSYKSQPKEGFLTKATIINIDKNMVILDVGLKTESYIPRREFGADEIKVGDIVDVFVERYEGPSGYVVASRDKARREESWTKLEEKVAKGEKVEGVIMERIRGGFIVDLYGVLAFMPGSQADVRPLHNQDELVGKKQEFKVLKMDYQRSNVIVSHRAVLEEQQGEKRKEMMKNIQVGDVVEGTIKNITDYGVFIDLGGIDGLLHVIDLSWKRVNHPKEMLSVGEKLKVKIIGYDEETQRISLGLKQLTEDPYKDLLKNIKIGDEMNGTVSSIADYGVFVEVEG
ncbi:MAG: S1 RNA-binding domain-containing protein, partial [Rickettsiales bacterium]|nr:S1 RNA-binding domain-containing protein [Rickettsiales bacterium]